MEAEKDNVIEFPHVDESAVSEVEKLIKEWPSADKDVILETIKLIPNSLEVLKSIYDRYDDFLKSNMTSNSEHVKRYLENCQRQMDLLGKILDRESLSTEELRLVIDCMNSIRTDEEKVVEKNREFVAEESEKQRSWVGQLIKWGLGTIAVLGGLFLISGRKDK